MTRPLRDDPRHQALRAANPTKHCGRMMCVRTLPSPEVWQRAKESYGDGYDAECVCPCLECHPAEVAYNNALDVARDLYGRTAADMLEAARVRVIAAVCTGG